MVGAEYDVSIRHRDRFMLKLAFGRRRYLGSYPCRPPAIPAVIAILSEPVEVRVSQASDRSASGSSEAMNCVRYKSSRVLVLPSAGPAHGKDFSVPACHERPSFSSLKKRLLYPVVGSLSSASNHGCGPRR